MANTSDPRLWRSIVVHFLDDGDLKGLAYSIAGGLEDWIQGRANVADLRELHWALEQLITAEEREKNVQRPTVA